EDDFRDAGALRALGKALAHLERLLRLLARLELGAGHREQRAARDVVDDLRADVLERPEDHEARALAGSVHLFANAEVAPMALLLTRFRNRWHCLLASRLTGLTANDFAGVLDALALIGLGWAQSTELRRDLTDERLVGAVDE